MNTDATIDTFAAPLMPCCFTAAAMKKIVTLLVPPMSRGLRPRMTVTGAVITDVRTPSMGGSPMAVAIARPYGSAIKAAITPPKQSPANNRQLYPPAFRNIVDPQKRQFKQRTFRVDNNRRPLRSARHLLRSAFYAMTLRNAAL